MKIIHALIHIKAEHREAFLQEATALVAGSRLEEANISYDLFESVEQANSFIVVEHWGSHAAIEIHNKAPHFRAFGKTTAQFMAAPPNVTVFEVAE